MKHRSITAALVASCLLLAGAANAEANKRPDREQVEVVGVMAAGEGQYVVVLRTQLAPARYLPIWIGEMEALNIRLRLQRQKPPRPLTLNLLEDILSTGKIELTEINIDDLRSGVFLGNISLKQAGRAWRIDARPSDAIGLALGTGAPIWVSRKVIEDAGVDPDTLDKDPPKPALPSEAPAAPGPAKPPVNYDETL